MENRPPCPVVKLRQEREWLGDAATINMGLLAELFRRRRRRRGSVLSLLIDTRLVYAHKVLLVSERLKTEFRVQSMGVASRQQNPPQSLQLRMVKDSAHDQFRYTTAAVLR